MQEQFLAFSLYFLATIHIPPGTPVNYQKVLFYVILGADFLGHFSS